MSFFVLIKLNDLGWEKINIYKKIVLISNEAKKTY